eukprot:COSAG04_NODE_1352_length_7118_cov_26.021228_1_plen_140_part_10
MRGLVPLLRARPLAAVPRVRPALSAHPGGHAVAASSRFFSQTVAVPSMGDSISEGELGAWLVGEGDAVNIDDVVCEIETDKVTSEVKAPCNGTITALLAEEGDTVETNQDLFTIEEGEGRGDAAPEPEAAPAAPAPAAAP